MSKKIYKYGGASLLVAIILYFGVGNGSLSIPIGKCFYTNGIYVFISNVGCGGGFGIGKTKIENADSWSFKPLSELYAKDKNNFYFGSRVIKATDSQTFKVLSRTYAKDKNHAYYGNEFIQDSDSQTFEPIKTNDEIQSYAKDKGNVYSGSEKIIDADPRTFIVMSDGGRAYSKDKNFVYHNSEKGAEKIKDADSKTFQILELNYAKDKNYVYFDGRIIKNAEPNSFTVLNNKYSEDKNFVYYNSPFADETMMTISSDVDNFKLLDDYCAKDKSNLYFDGVVDNKGLCTSKK